MLRTIRSLVILFLIPMTAQAAPLTTEVLSIPIVNKSSSYSLNALMVKPANVSGKLPVVLLAHGAPARSYGREMYVPELNQPQAEAIAAHGYVVVSIERRGFGRSNVPYAEGTGGCANRDYSASAKQSNADMAGAWAFLSKRPDVDAKRMVLFGKSAGGFVVLQYAATRPDGLRAVVNFSGGRGSNGQGKVCDPNQLNRIFKEMGKKSKKPELWVYSKNDLLFTPSIYKEWFSIYRGKSKNVELWEAPEFGVDGHELFAKEGISIWIDHVVSFLNKNTK